MIYPDVKALAQGKNFAAFTTLLPGGQPMTHVMWVDADDTHILINSEMGRQKVRNVTEGPPRNSNDYRRGKPLSLRRGSRDGSGAGQGPRARAILTS